MFPVSPLCLIWWPNFNKLTLNAREEFLKACQTQNCRDYYMLWLLPNLPRCLFSIYFSCLCHLPDLPPAIQSHLLCTGTHAERAVLGNPRVPVLQNSFPTATGNVPVRIQVWGFTFPPPSAPLVESFPSFLDFFTLKNPATRFIKVKAVNRWTGAV